MSATATSMDKPLPRIPTFIDAIRRRLRCLYHHPKIQKIEGYHFGILCCAVVSATVMVVNCTLTIWASRRYDLQGGIGTIRDGSCSETRDIAVWIHLGINVLSTLLLGASNYTMQCLSSPTREDINRAHSHNVWLNVGTPSIRNLLRISRSRMLLWWLVAISSVPLHLLYNSAVFTTLSAREYDVFLVTSDFLTGAPFNLNLTSTSMDSLDYSANEAFFEKLELLEPLAQTLQDSQSGLQKLTSKDCIGTYATAPMRMSWQFRLDRIKATPFYGSGLLSLTGLRMPLLGFALMRLAIPRRLRKRRLGSSWIGTLSIA